MILKSRSLSDSQPRFLERKLAASKVDERVVFLALNQRRTRVEPWYIARWARASTTYKYAQGNPKTIEKHILFSVHFTSSRSLEAFVF